MELEFRSGVSFEGFWKRGEGGLRVWTEREFINPDALGDLLGKRLAAQLQTILPGALSLTAARFGNTHYDMAGPTETY